MEETAQLSSAMQAPVTAQQLRHTFANQMLAVGIPLSSLQRYLGHELMDTTMIYAEVSNPMLQQDYYRGITTLDPQPANLTYSFFQLEQLHQLIDELKTDDLDPICKRRYWNKCRPYSTIPNKQCF